MTIVFVVGLPAFCPLSLNALPRFLSNALSDRASLSFAWYTVCMSGFPSVAIQELGTVLRFPLWWYGEGFFAVMRWMRADLGFAWRRLGIRLWMRAWLQPMYGVSDLVGRLISIAMRTVVIAARLLWWSVQAAMYALAALAWLLWIPAACGLLLAPLLW